jgi:hypothetical protein
MEQHHGPRLIFLGLLSALKASVMPRIASCRQMSACRHQLATQWRRRSGIRLTGGPWGTLDQAEAARAPALREKGLAAAWRRAVRDEASMVDVREMGIGVDEVEESEGVAADKSR